MKDTRELLLDSAATSFYKHGYQGANIAAILKEVGINKGSMYHFFKSKKALALAVIKERIERNLMTKYDAVLAKEHTLKSMFDTLRSAPETLVYGCPLNKMSQEMVYLDDDFKSLLSEVYKNFENVIELILRKAKIKDASQKAKLIIATYEGALMSYHLTQNKEQFREILTTLEESLV
jgi:TetR/AcrR family transcriptional repressor of nem operon